MSNSFANRICVVRKPKCEPSSEDDWVVWNKMEEKQKENWNASSLAIRKHRELVKKNASDEEICTAKVEMSRVVDKEWKLYKKQVEWFQRFGFRNLGEVREFLN